MTNINVIENKISSIKKYLELLENFKKNTRVEIEQDDTIRAALERYLYLVSQAVIDLSEAVVAIKNLRKPTTMRESFQILGEKKILSPALETKMIGLVGFRNVIAHDYDKVNYDKVYDVLHNRLEDIKEFIEIISNSI